MILWTFKLIRSVRKAIAGRKHPGQLAWGVAFGALLGMIPHGNLLAIALLLFVLMLQVNHAMVALVGIAVTFGAPRLDPTFDALGRWVFAQPQVADRLSLAWQYPLVPWTDLNNTIVMGSLLIGLIAVGPLYLISYPLFRAWAPVDAAADEDDATSETDSSETDSSEVEMKAEGTARPTEIDQTVCRIDDGHVNRDISHQDRSDESKVSSAAPIAAPAPATSPQNSQLAAGAEATRVTTRATAPQSGSRTTRVAIGTSKSGPVMRSTMLSHPRPVQSRTAVDSYGSPVDEQHKIDEALSYLLRQLRDSKDKDAA